MSEDRKTLPVVETASDAEPAVCSTKAYVSNEELAVLAAMRQIRQRGIEIRRQLDGVDVQEASRRDLEEKLETVRGEWNELNQRREAAYVRKMVMLGHLPPEALDGLEEF